MHPRSRRPTLVILVRHAEKAAEPAADPSAHARPALRARGRSRAALANTHVDAVITTELIRTRETARPLAEARGLTPEIVHSGARDAHAKAVADAVRAHAGQTVLVVGHSNTIPAIIAALRRPQVPGHLRHAVFESVRLVVSERRADLVASSYGAPSPIPRRRAPASLK